MTTPESQLREKALQGKSIYDTSDNKPANIRPAAPAAVAAAQRHGLIPPPLRPYLRHGITFLGLVTATLLVLYGPMLYRQADYWWRQRTKEPLPERPTEEVNAIYPGDLAYFEVDRDDVDNNVIEPVIPHDNRIVIDKIEVNAPIVEMGSYSDKDVLTAIREGVGHYPETAQPGEAGNVVLTGHSSYWWWDSGNYKFVFQHLSELVIGDTITVYHNQQRFDYRVRDMKEVKPTGPHVDDIFAQDPYKGDPVLTLITCTPVGTTLRRLIVTAELVS